MKILHFSDVHGEDTNHEEIKRCVDYMVETAWKVKPDAIICSGDIINSKYLQADSKSLKYMSSYFRELSNIAPIAVIIGTDSHEGRISETLRNVSGKYSIHVSTTVEQILLCETPGQLFWRVFNSGMIGINVKLIVSQVPPPTKEFWKNRQGIEKDNQNISQAMASIFTNFGVMAKQYPNVPHVLNGHFSMQGSKISETQLIPGTDISIGKDILAMANADLYCLGHIHMKQEYQITDSTKAFHSGSIFRKNFGERKEDKGFYIHTLTGNDYDLDSYKFVKTPSREMGQVEFNLIESPWMLDDPEQDFVSKAVDICSEWCNIEAWLKIKITAWTDDVRQINQAKLKRDLLEAGAKHVVIEIDRVRRENSREEEIIKAASLPEKAKALEAHRSQPMPDGCIEFFENVETLNKEDLVKYALNQIN
jgi:DNA repair exonuclease SbcCD nuclease subunit